MEKKTPLYNEHVALSGKIVPFAGYLLPVQYSGIIAEHTAVRTDVGIFDVSHMGELLLTGADALANLNYIMTNKFDSMKEGDCRYTVMLYEDGGQVDDLIVYKKGEGSYLLVLNASNTQKDIEWIKSHLTGHCQAEDLSDKTAQIALQGPKALEVISKLCDEATLPTKNYTFKENIEIDGISCLVSRTGYTGEFGYEIYMPSEGAPKVWQALLKGGATPCGLGARDTLRLEASMPLYGHELSDKIHIMSTGLNFAIKKDKENFIGKEAVINAPEDLPVRVGIKVTGRGIVREHEGLFANGEQIGETTSGTHLPHLGAPYAMAYVKKEFAEVGTPLTALVRGREIAVEVVPLPFYKK